MAARYQSGSAGVSTANQNRLHGFMRQAGKLRPNSQAIEGLLKDGGAERFVQAVIKASGEAGVYRFDAGVGGEDDEAEAGADVGHGTKQTCGFHPVHAGHLKVNQGQVCRVFGEVGDGLGSREKSCDLMTHTAEDEAQDFNISLQVVRYDDAQRGRVERDGEGVGWGEVDGIGGGGQGQGEGENRADSRGALEGERSSGEGDQALAGDQTEAGAAGPILGLAAGLRVGLEEPGLLVGVEAGAGVADREIVMSGGVC